MPKRKSEWEELDAWAVMRERADTLLKKLYKLTTRTASEISKGTKIDMDLTQKALDYLVEQGKINRFDDAPGYDKPVYGISPEKDKIATSNADMELAERVVWHCLGKKGRLVDAEIDEETGLGMQYTGQAIGSLAYDGKLRMFRNRKTGAEAFSLTDKEQRISNRQRKKSRK